MCHEGGVPVMKIYLAGVVWGRMVRILCLV